MIVQILTPLLLMQAAPSEAPATQAAPQLNVQQRASLRCSAAFALVSYGQSQGNADALKWPKLETRGREFFVRTSASIMDQLNLNREQVSELVAKEAQALTAPNELKSVMPACLSLMETSDL